MSIDFATFSTVAPHILDSKLPVLIRGRHGVGKSEVVYQIAAARELASGRAPRQPDDRG